nr:MAG: hypothetical protein [Plasmopara viticola lesion associated narnavirus 1]
MCLHNRTVADAYICMGTTGNLGLESPEKPVHTALIQKYSKLVAEGFVSCTNSQHFHVSDRRNVFYELVPGLDTSLTGAYKVLLGTVEYPQQPKDPCTNTGIPVPSWSTKVSNVFDTKELAWVHSRWEKDLEPARAALCQGEDAWKAFLSVENRQERLMSVRTLLRGAKAFAPGRITDTSWRNLGRQDPTELAYKAYGRTAHTWEPT